MITEQTPYRDVRPVSFETWNTTITRAGGRSELASRAAYEAAGSLSGVLLRILEQESSFDTDYRANSRSNNNPYNIRVPDRSNEGNPRGYVAYKNLVESTDAAARRISGEAGFFEGENPYAKTVTIRQLISTYAPPAWNDTEGLIKKMVNRLNEWGVGTEGPVVTYTYNNGTHPAFLDIVVSESNKFAGYISPSQHIIRAFVIHSAYGYLESTTVYFQDGSALTDYMVGNTLDGASLDGQLRRFNNPRGARYSYASGPVNNPIEDAAKLLEIYGPNREVVNMYTTALERTCDIHGSAPPVSEKEHARRVQIIAYWANEYGKYLKEKTGEDRFTCDTFPLIPSENNRSFLIYHGEINADKRMTCPDKFVRQTLDRIIADVRALLGSWQKSGVPIPPQVPPDQMPVYAEPKPVESLQTYKGKDPNAVPAFVVSGDTRFIFVNDRVRAKRATPRYQTAETSGDKIGPDIEANTEFAVLWLFWDANGTPWYITPYWTRVLVNDTERISDQA